MSLGLAVIYFVFNCGPMFIQENREFKKKLNAVLNEAENKDDANFVENARALTVMRRASNFIKFSKFNVIDYKQVR
jgi:hypothetical protein